MTESDLQSQVADYLRLQYPNVMFHSDFGSGVRLTVGQALRQKRQNGGRRAWPDMFVAEPQIDGDDCGNISEQAEVLEKLRERGYCAEFAVGFDEAKRIIDEYLGK